MLVLTKTTLNNPFPATFCPSLKHFISPLQSHHEPYSPVQKLLSLKGDSDNCKCNKCNVGDVITSGGRNKSWIFVNNSDGCKTRDS